MREPLPPPEEVPELMRAGESEPGWVPGYPWWVRALAVMHVLSLVVAPVLFLIFAFAAGVLVLRRGRVGD